MSNFSETLHSKRKLKNKQVARIWSLYLKKLAQQSSFQKVWKILLSKKKVSKNFFFSWKNVIFDILCKYICIFQTCFKKFDCMAIWISWEIYKNLKTCLSNPHRTRSVNFPPLCTVLLSGILFKILLTTYQTPCITKWGCSSNSTWLLFIFPARVNKSKCAHLLIA